MTNEQMNDRIDQATAARLAGVSARTVHRWAERRLISVVRDPVSGRPYYLRSELEAALREVRARPRLGNGQYAPRVTS